jgi:hypothetical protein
LIFGNPILERRSVLERVLKPRAGIQLGSYVEDEGTALFNLTKEKGMEGIIAKRKDGIYRPGRFNRFHSEGEIRRNGLMRVVVVCRFYGDQEPIGALGHNKISRGYF